MRTVTPTNAGALWAFLKHTDGLSVELGKKPKIERDDLCEVVLLFCTACAPPHRRSLCRRSGARLGIPPGSRFARSLRGGWYAA
jgi:hypothetical protein